MDQVKTTMLSRSVENKVFWFEKLVLEQPAFDDCSDLVKITYPEVDGRALEPQLAVAESVDAVAPLS